MLRLLFKTAGLLSLAGAFAALIVDGTRSVAAGAAVIEPLGQTASRLSPSGFAKFHEFVAVHAPALWDPVLVTILLVPTWVVLGLLGLFLLLLTRPRAPKIGYTRR